MYIIMPWHPWSFRGCVAPSVFDFIFNAKWCSLFLPRLPIPTPWKREKDSKPVKSMKACHRTACIIHLHGKRVDKNHIKPSVLNIAGSGWPPAFCFFHPFSRLILPHKIPSSVVLLPFSYCQSTRWICDSQNWSPLELLTAWIWPLGPSLQPRPQTTLSL